MPVTCAEKFNFFEKLNFRFHNLDKPEKNDPQISQIDTVSSQKSGEIILFLL